jgi:hypothetical protein
MIKFGFQSESIRATIKYETVKAFPLVEYADHKQIYILTQNTLS